MTLVELMVACMIGCLILMSMVMVFSSSSRSFVAIGNYMEMDRSSRNALDRMTREIRNAKDLVSFSPTQLVLNSAGTNRVVYNWTLNPPHLTEWKTGGQTNVLLTGCDSLTFAMFKHVPLSGGSNAPTTVVAEGKALSVSWTCSRTFLGKRFSTEDMQQAIIVIRNKPVL
jgi:hypothetical protein